MILDTVTCQVVQVNCGGYVLIYSSTHKSSACYNHWQTLDEHKCSVTRLAWTQTGCQSKHLSDRLTLATADVSGKILVWNVNSGEVKARLQDNPTNDNSLSQVLPELHQYPFVRLLKNLLSLFSHHRRQWPRCLTCHGWTEGSRTLGTSSSPCIGPTALSCGTRPKAPRFGGTPSVASKARSFWASTLIPLTHTAWFSGRAMAPPPRLSLSTTSSSPSSLQMSPPSRYVHCLLKMLFREYQNKNWFFSSAATSHHQSMRQSQEKVASRCNESRKSGAKCWSLSP